MGNILKKPKFLIFLLITVILLTVVFYFQNQKIVELVQAQGINGVLRVHPTNSRYFTDNSDKAIYLTGSYDADMITDYMFTLDITPFEWNAYLDKLNLYDINHMRMWIAHGTSIEDIDTKLSDPIPWLRSAVQGANDGDNKFDVNKAYNGEWNNVFFNRLKQRVEEAESRGIYCSIMFFEAWHTKYVNLGSEYVRGWKYHVFNSDNNINGIDGDLNNDNDGKEIHTLDPSVSAITALQKEFIKKTIDTVHNSDNILWEIINEADDSSTAWQNHMIDFIKQYEIDQGYKKHPVGMTAYGNFDITNDNLFDSNADWISPGAKESGSQSYVYAIDPPATNGSKVIILDSDHVGEVREGRVPMDPWIWKSFVRGHNPILLDPYDVYNGVDMVSAREKLKDTRIYAEKADITDMVPENDLSSTGYCLAKAGEKYIIYQSESGNITVSDLISNTDYNYEWFNPVTSQIISTGSITTTGTSQSFPSPFSGPSVLFLYVPTCQRVDFICDQNIDINDFNLFKSYFQTQNPLADFNNDQKTNTQDLGIMMSVWGTY